MAGAMTELDPQFIKALGYLWSKSPDSLTKLKKMLDDAIEQSMKKKQDIKVNLDKSAPGIKGSKHLAKITKSGSSHDLKKKEKDLAQKRQFDKIQKDLEELNQEVSKKSRLDRPSSPTTAFLSGDAKPKSNAESSGPPLTGSDNKDFTLEIDDLACAICNGFSADKGTPVECQECHNMYHRECHQPPISHQDANDPRCVWYCSWCVKNMKKVAKQINSKPSSASTSNPVRDRLNSLESKNKSAFVTPFKRNEIKTTLQSSANNGSGGGSLSGWAALSGKNIHSMPSTSKITTTKPLSVPTHKLPLSTAVALSKEKRDKLAKAAKGGAKLAVSDAWAEALGADLPPAPMGTTKVGSHKSGSKPSSSWGSSSKSSVFPKATAASVGGSSLKGSAPPGANAEKRLQMLKKKAKLNPKKSKI